MKCKESCLSCPYPDCIADHDGNLKLPDIEKKTLESIEEKRPRRLRTKHGYEIFYYRPIHIINGCVSTVRR